MDSQYPTGSPRLRLTPPGAVFIALALLLGLAAVNTGNNLLYLLEAALLGLLGASGVLGHLNMARLQVALELPEEVYSGRPVRATLRVFNRKKRSASFMLNLHLQGKRRSIPLLPPASETDVSLPVTFGKRGRHPLPNLRLESSFPMTFFIHALPLSPSGERVVYPSPRRCTSSSGFGRQAQRGEEAGQQEQTDGELAQILDYTGAEPMKRIHWKLSARQDGLKVKDLSAAGREPILLNIDHLPGRTLDERLGSGCYLVNRYLREQRPVGLQVGTRVIAPSFSRRHRHKLLTELAVHDPG